jgi:predicted phosphoribosyltransferase
MALFKDRADAGRKLAKSLSKYANRSDVLILALPRGGVPVAFEVAKALNVKMDVFIVRKLGVPGHEELAMGAIASGNIRVLNEDIVGSLQIPPQIVERVAEGELKELERREQMYRGSRQKLDVTGLTVILIDDGLATGATMRAAAAALKTKNPARIVVAVPVAAADTCQLFQHEVDETICLAAPEPIYAVGAWYGDFSQTTDREVCDLLDKAASIQPGKS